jgi:hypothetical protein
MENEFKGRIIFSDNYQATIDNIRMINNSVSKSATIIKALNDDVNTLNGSQISIISGYEAITRLSIDKLRGSQGVILSAYDESILELNSLEGKVRCVAHCCIIQANDEYIPSAYVSLKFFTKSNIIEAKATLYSDIIKTDDLSKAINEEYINERSYFLSKAAPVSSLIFIDGSMFSGAATAGNFVLVDKLLKSNCRPIFFVKNSESTIITEKFAFAKGYNSDLHWAYSSLKVGEYSQVFSYKSPDGREKAMCFFKIFDKRSPVRIEFPLRAFEEGLYPDDIFELIYYQYLANGSSNNVQPRIIQIAELYAREVLQSTNLYNEIERMGLTKSMNEARGF